ncbi:hypothetical protein BTS2_0875 [Bacillus sp. TS-2]|nr:hypothetical protein BTS2_0875 [Bacillus sp. TS-2]
MTRISKISSLRSSRIQENYVRSFSPESVKKVEPLSTINRTENYAESISENKIMSFEQYYNQLQKSPSHKTSSQSFCKKRKKTKLQPTSSINHFLDKYNLLLKEFLLNDCLYGSNSATLLINCYKFYKNPLKALHISFNEKQELVRDHTAKIDENEQPSISKLEKQEAISAFEQFKLAVLKSVHMISKEKDQPYNSHLNIAAYQARGLVVESRQ